MFKNYFDIIGKSKEVQELFSGFKRSFVVRSLTISDRQNQSLQIKLREHTKLRQYILGIQVILGRTGKDVESI